MATISESKKEDIGSGEIDMGDTITGSFGRINAIIMDYRAGNTIDRWNEDEETERNREKDAALRILRLEENEPLIKKIWEELVKREAQWQSTALEVLNKYGEGAKTWNDWTPEQKINFAWYIYSSKTCEDINSSNCERIFKIVNLQKQGGGFFFSKKKTRKRRKKKTRKKKKKKKKKKTRKKKDRKWTDTNYPYRDISAKEAIEEFQKLKKLVKGNINPRSIVGNKTVDWGTEKARRKTKYRNRSFIEMWKNKTRRKKMMQFAKRLHKAYRGPDGKKKGNKTIQSSIRSAIDLQWGSVNTMRAAAAAQMYKKYKATRVLDFTAGWGARMIAAMALNIDYIGIDSNKALKPGYDKIIKLLKPYTKSNIKMIYKEAEKVKFSKLGKYDYVFTSPPYEYLEAYENMTNYEKKGSKIVQPSSSRQIKMDHSTEFYDEFLVPTLKKAYKYLPRNKYICLNMPDMMYDKIKKRWKKVTRKETYQIIKRTGGPIGKDRRGKECIFCWKKS
jgi:hypothetical protein